MASLLTGATGLHGLHLVELAPAREGEVRTIVRRASLPRGRALIALASLLRAVQR
jgi:uncharacterized protein YbjT (DUF2867 family)